jgi:hypothetical protein
MLVFNHFFLSYYFLEFDEFISSIQDTYNNQLNERYRDDPSTHPDVDLDLWLKVSSFNGPDRNRECGFSNIMTENLWTTHGASTVECS